MADPSTGIMLGVSGLLTYAGGTYNVQVERVSGEQEVSQSRYRPRDQTQVRVIDRAVDGYVAFNGEATQGQQTGLGTVPAGGTGTLTWDLGNGTTEALKVQLRRVRVTRSDSRRENLSISGEFRVVQDVGGADQTDADGDGDVYVYHPDTATRRGARQSAIVRGISTGAGTYPMVQDATEAWANANTSLGGLPIDTASGRAIGKDTVRIDATYRDPIGPGVVYVFTPPRSGKQRQVIKTVGGLSDSNGIEQMTNDAVDAWVAANDTLDGIPLARAVGRALDDSTVRIRATYQHIYGIGDTFTFAPQGFKRAARQAETITGITADVGTHKMVEDAVNNWAASNASLAGLPLDRATGQAVSEDAVRVQGTYSSQESVVGALGEASRRGQVTSVRVPRWKDIDETDWLRKDGNGDPIGSEPVQQAEPQGTLSYTVQQATSPLNDASITPKVGKFNSDGFLGAAANTLLFNGASYGYFPTVELYLVTLNFTWRPLGWTEDHMELDETDRPLKLLGGLFAYTRIDLTQNNTTSFGGLPTPP